MLIHEAHSLPPRSLLERVGVTRIARITGLDRTGVEVCSAIRPGGHVLQVSNGKGLTFERAAAAALSEAAELWAAENVRTHELKYGSRRQLEDAGLVCIWPDENVSVEAYDLFMGWTRAELLGSRQEVWAPAHVVYCPRAGTFLGARVFPWTTNGLAAHATRSDAVLHALREVIEREVLSHSFTNGWTEDCVQRRVRAPDELSGLVAGIEHAGFQVELFDASARRDVPVAAALLFDKEGGPIPMTAGYACAADYVLALESAVLEAAQSRLTDIHGAREDVTPGASGAAETVRAWFDKPARSPWKGKRVRGLSAAKEIAVLQRAFRGVPFAVVDLAVQPLNVVRVIAPGFSVSELL